jgi:ribose transport system permease protein
MSTLAPDRKAELRRDRSSRKDRLLRGMRTPGGAVFILLLVLLAAVIWVNPSFGEPGSLIRFIGRTAPIAIAAIGQYFVIVSGEFDLSMGSVVTAQVIIAGNLIGQDDAKVLPVLLLMLVFGALIGLINGLVTTLLKIPSFIVTLGMMLALLGLVLYWTGGAATGNPADTFRQIGRGGIQDVPVLEVLPYPVLILLAVAAGAFWLMRRPYGRTLIAVGDNARAAALTGGARVVDPHPRLHALLARRHSRRHHPGWLRRSAPLGGARL